jgi:N-acyl-D-amino-acid deacylase
VAGEDVIAPVKAVDWMRRLSVAIGRPVTFALLQIDDAPDLWRELMDESLRAAEEGAQLWPQVAARATGLLTGLHSSYCLFDSIPAYQALKARNLSDEQLVVALSDPSVRDAIVSFQPEPEHRGALERAYAVNFVLGTPPNYEPGPENSLAAIAAAAGRHPLEVAYEVMLADDGHGLLYFPILNYSSMSLEPVREMLLHPRAVAGLGDGGAHCGVICDSPQPTFMLSHWTRDRTRGDLLPLEWVVKKQTHDTAALYGLGDRGTLEPGLLADLNVIDYDHLQLGTPKVVTDLPAGGRRLVQDAVGYLATVKSGVTTFEHGTETGARPGTLVRGAR